MLVLAARQNELLKHYRHVDINRQITNRSDKSVADLLPMKHLP